MSRRSSQLRTKHTQLRKEGLNLLGRIRALTDAIPGQRLNLLSKQASWELVIKLVRNIPGKDEDEMMNRGISN